MQKSAFLQSGIENISRSQVLGVMSCSLQIHMLIFRYVIKQSFYSTLFYHILLDEMLHCSHINILKLYIFYLLPVFVIIWLLVIQF